MSSYVAEGGATIGSFAITDQGGSPVDGSESCATI
jgi:hypothetical protein